MQHGVHRQAVPLGLTDHRAAERVPDRHHPGPAHRPELPVELHPQLLGEQRQRPAQLGRVAVQAGLDPTLGERARRPDHHRQPAVGLLHQVAGALIVPVEVGVYHERGAARNQDADHLGRLVNGADQLRPGAPAPVGVRVEVQQFTAGGEDRPGHFLVDVGEIRVGVGHGLGDPPQILLDADLERYARQRGRDRTDLDRVDRRGRDDLGAGGHQQDAGEGQDRPELAPLRRSRRSGRPTLRPAPNLPGPGPPPHVNLPPRELTRACRAPLSHPHSSAVH